MSISRLVVLTLPDMGHRSTTDARTSIAADVAAALDLALTGSVLIVGSPPPHGRDLDLLASPLHASTIRGWLERAGFVPWRHTWARFDEPRRYAVELATTESWRTRWDDASCLFADPAPIPGFRHLVSPCPATVLLLAARSTAQRRGRITDKARRRMSAALKRDPSAWGVAEVRARGLGLLGPLRLLRAAYRAGRPLSVGARTVWQFRALLYPSPYEAKARILRGALPRRLRPAIVSFSGLDGSGKTTQVSRLQHQLGELGVSTERQWGGSFKYGKQLVAAVPLLRRARQGDSDPPGFCDERIPAALQGSPAGRQAWTSVLVILNALYLWGLVLRRRPGTAVLVLDRFTPDCAARLDLHFLRSHSTASQRQRQLFALISPKPDVGFLVDVPSQVAYGRRQDQTPEELGAMSELYREQVARFGLHRLDGTDPADVLASQVAVAVWRALP